MKKLFAIAFTASLYVLVAFAMCQPGWAQTTYTTTQDACSGKANQFCQLPTDQGPVTIDNRNEAEMLYLGTFGVNGYHGLYSGFVANPDHTLNPFNGVGSFASDSGTVNGSFQFYAYYVKSCSGRGCGSTIGWHYRILAGSTVEVQ